MAESSKAPVEALRVAFSTDMLADPDYSADCWQDALFRAGINCSLNMLPPPDYRANMAVHGYDGFGLLSGQTSSAVFGGERSETDPGAFTFSFSHGPALGVRHLGRESVVEGGAAVLLSLDSESIIDLRAQGMGGLSVLCLPNDLVEPALSRSDFTLNRAIAGNAPPFDLLRRYVRVLAARGDVGAIAHQAIAVRHIHDFVALTLGAGGDDRDERVARSAAPVRLAILKADIAANLTRPNLGAPWLARRHGITPRHVHRLFEREGRSLSLHIAEHRLLEAYRRLADTRGNGGTIASIALHVGFNDLSYFNRRFQRRFGARPGDIRAIFGTSRAGG